VEMCKIKGQNTLQHITRFVHRFTDQLMLVDESHWQSTDFGHLGLTGITENHFMKNTDSDFLSSRLWTHKVRGFQTHWYFKLI